jgi:hypothetical protein
MNFGTPPLGRQGAVGDTTGDILTRVLQDLDGTFNDVVLGTLMPALKNAAKTLKTANPDPGTKLAAQIQAIETMETTAGTNAGRVNMYIETMTLLKDPSAALSGGRKSRRRKARRYTRRR